jgi:hypothetical protein
MARKAVVDRDVILKMLRDGRTTQSIAGEFGVSRQAIDLHRRDFIRQGLLPDQRAARGRKPAPLPGPAPRRPETVKEAFPGGERYSSGATGAADAPAAAVPAASAPLDEQIELVIDAFAALKRLPGMERELAEYRKKYEEALLEIGRLRTAEQKRLDQERRWYQVRLPENDVS